MTTVKNISLMSRRSRLLVSIILISCAVVFLGAFTAYPADNGSPATVTDLSDRKYEKAVIGLLDNAKESIVISMYCISPGSGERNPVKLLLNDLLEARARGVSVTMYLNTRPTSPDIDERVFIDSPFFTKLKDAGCLIYLVPRGRRLHDKLIIVDNRYVVVGSANWSNSALRSNFETSTLIDSPAHAREKFKRLENVLGFIKSNSEISGTPAYLEELPEELSVPKELMADKKYFSRMVTEDDDRAFDLYLLLLAHGLLEGENEFFINLEDMALSMGMPASWSYGALRRQMIKSLKKLHTRYGLIDVKFSHGRDAYVTLNDIPGGSFAVSSDSIISTRGPGPTLRLKFLLLIEALLKSEGKDLSAVAKSGLARRFNVNKSTIHEAFNDLKIFERK